MTQSLHHGRITQGGRLTENPEWEQVDVAQALRPAFGFRVTDTSLMADDILPGDVLLLTKQQFYRNGDRVLAVNQDRQTCCRRFVQDESQDNVLGRVIGVLRETSR